MELTLPSAPVPVQAGEIQIVARNRVDPEGSITAVDGVILVELLDDTGAPVDINPTRFELSTLPSAMQDQLAAMLGAVRDQVNLNLNQP